MIKKGDYVTVELAKLLEKAGFNDPCKSTWKVTGTEEKLTWNPKIMYKEDLDKEIYGCQSNDYLAPTYYEADMWLKRVHKLHIAITPFGVSDTSYIWDFKIYNLRTICSYANEVIEDDTIHEYHSYKEALRQGIEYSLKLIEQQN